MTTTQSSNGRLGMFTNVSPHDIADLATHLLDLGHQQAARSCWEAALTTRLAPDPVDDQELAAVIDQLEGRLYLGESL